MTKPTKHSTSPEASTPTANPGQSDKSPGQRPGTNTPPPQGATEDQSIHWPESRQHLAARLRTARMGYGVDALMGREILSHVSHLIDLSETPEQVLTVQSAIAMVYATLCTITGLRLHADGTVHDLIVTPDRPLAIAPWEMPTPPAPDLPWPEPFGHPGIPEDRG